MASTVMEEITASTHFVDYFTARFNQSSVCYNFAITDLRTKISELTAHEDSLLIFFLHHSKDDFSFNFCYFLQDPVIEAAFIKDKFILYCWDIECDYLKPKLIQGCRDVIGDVCTSYIKQNKSITLLIKLENGIPVISDVYDDARDLLKLHNVLTESPTEIVEEVITPSSYQKLMASLLGNRDYNSYEKTQHDLLKKNIGYALYGYPTEQDGKEYRKDQQKEIEKLFSQILKENDAFCKWNGRVIISFIYVCVETLPKDKEKNAKRCAKKNQAYNADTDFVPYPVFVLRKCKHIEDPTRACRIVIDHEGRVYRSWENYLENNRLPPCKMLYPEHGRYNSGKNSVFNTRLSPACDLSKKVANASDIAAGVTGLVAGGVSTVVSVPAILAASPLIAAAAPIALPVAIAVGISSGLYSIGKSIYNLVDRKMHKQDIHLSDVESRAAYLNLVGGVLSASTFGATKVASLLVEEGILLGQGTKFVLYGMNGLNLTVNGIGIGNSIYEMVHAKKASPLCIAQICASILFFGNALYNFKTISSIIEESQTSTMTKYLRTFKKLLSPLGIKEEILGGTSIAPMRTMDIDDFITTLRYASTILDNHGIQFNTAGGQIHLNGVPVNLDAMSDVDQVPFSERFPPIPENLTSNSQNSIMQDVKFWLIGIGILSKLINPLSIKQVALEICSAFEPFVRNYILDISKRFFKRLDPAIANRLIDVVKITAVELIKWIVNKLEDKKIFKKYFTRQNSSNNHMDGVVDDLEKEFPCQYLKYEYGIAVSDMRKRQRKINNERKIQKDCTACSGYHYTSLK